MTDVLRSRYTAFAWRMIEYVISTTHESCGDYREDRVSWANDMNRNGMFDSFEFVNLIPGEEEIDALDEENAGFVEFRVTFRAKESNGGGGGGGITTTSSPVGRLSLSSGRGSCVIPSMGVGATRAGT